MKERQECALKILQAWQRKDVNIIKDIITDDTIYKEHFGDKTYRGKDEILERCKEFYANHDLISYDVRQVIYKDFQLVFDWECSYLCHEKEMRRSRMSIIKFTEDHKIESLKEYASTFS